MKGTGSTVEEGIRFKLGEVRVCSQRCECHGTSSWNPVVEQESRSGR